MSWSPWTPPTARDVLGQNRPVACPQCRRPCAPDMLQPTVDLPAAVLARFRRPAAFLCDGCRATLHREGRITAADWARFLGAPEAVAARLEARQAARPGAGQHGVALATLDARRGIRRDTPR